jgi:hypothetical protein
VSKQDLLEAVNLEGGRVEVKRPYGRAVSRVFAGRVGDFGTSRSWSRQDIPGLGEMTDDEAVAAVLRLVRKQ